MIALSSAASFAIFFGSSAVNSRMPADAFASEKTFLIESLMWGMLDYCPVSQDLHVTLGLPTLDPVRPLSFGFVCMTFH